MITPLWFSNLLFWSAQVALLALAAGFLPRLFQIRQPGILLGYWRALLAVSLVLPVVQPWHRAQRIAVSATAPDSLGAALSLPTSPVVSHWHLPSFQFIAEIVGLAILAGIATRFLIFGMGLLKLRHLRRTSLLISPFPESAALLEEISARVSARAEFRLSANVDSPVTFGFAPPVVLLPERFVSMDTRFQTAIACHEMLHVRRQDWAHHLSEEIIRAVFWFHPAIAWLIARLRLAREQVVDLAVVRLTQARKPYLEALLEFTHGRASVASIPAPLFLAEQQLVERVSLMLKEVRMSRKRLIASLTVISCCLALVVVLAAWTFPLKAAPPTAQSAPISGVASGVSRGATGGAAQGVSGGVPGGVAGGISNATPSQGTSGGIKDGVIDGISGGVAGGVRGSASQNTPTVDISTIWTAAVKRGPMIRQVRGLGTLVRAENSAGLVARVALPVVMTAEVKPNQNATIDTRKGLVKGHVIGINSSSSDGTGILYVSLDGPLPEGAGIDLPIDATIDIEKLDNILYVGRPVHATANSTVSLFKLAKDGAEAERVNVKLGRSSVNAIEVLDGLKEGDKVILSDMSAYDNADRIRLK